MLGRRTVASHAVADDPGHEEIQATHPYISMQSLPRASGRKWALLLSPLASHFLHFSLPCCWVTVCPAWKDSLFRRIQNKSVSSSNREMISRKLCFLFQFRESTAKREQKKKKKRLKNLWLQTWTDFLLLLANLSLKLNPTLTFQGCCSCGSI